MSYEPRSRGMRSRRIATKKPASKSTKGGEENEFFYEEPVPVNPQEVSSRVMNALGHLGSQRFGMPPFAEHFQRWILDVESVLNDFRTSLPKATSDDFAKSSSQLLSNIRSELDARIATEKTLSARITESQRQLSANEREIADLEAKQRTKMHEARRASEKSIEKLRDEIGALDDERLKLLRHKPTILERVFGSVKGRIEGNSRTLQSRRTDLEGREEDLTKRLNSLRSSYDEKRKPLALRREELSGELEKLRATTLDDALEIRMASCEKLRETVAGAVAQLAPKQDQDNPQ